MSEIDFTQKIGNNDVDELEQYDSKYNAYIEDGEFVFEFTLQNRA